MYVRNVRKSMSSHVSSQPGTAASSPLIQIECVRSPDFYNDLSLTLPRKFNPWLFFWL